MIRKGYLIPRLAVLALLWLFFAVAFDPLVRRGLEEAGSAALGAKVEIGSLDTDFFPPRVLLTRFAAADPGAPMQNLLEFSSARLSLEGRPLLERKVVVAASEVAGLAWGTPRKRSGALPRAPSSKLASKLGEWARQSKELSFGAVTGAQAQAKERLTVKAEDLKSAQLAKELEERWPKAAGEWKERARGYGAEAKLKELERLAQEAGSGDPLSRAAKAAEAAKKVQELKQGAERVKKDLEAEAAKAKSDLEAVKKAKAADLDALRSRLQLPSLDPGRLSAYLLGPETAARLTKILRLVEAARKKMPAKGAQREPTPGRGATIEFPRERSWPAFWLKEARLAGSADLGGPIEFSGLAADFSSDPPLAGRPARLELAGGQGARKAKLAALLDHLKEVPRDEVSFEYAGLPMPAFTAGDPSSFSVTVGPGSAAVSGSVTLVGPSLSGTIRYRQAGAELTPSGGGGTAARLAAAAFKGIKEIDAELSLGGTLEEPRFSIKSNLGSALAGGLKAAVGREAEARLADAQAQISKLVDGRVGALQGRLDADLGAALEPLGLGRLKELEERLKKQAGVPLGLPKLFR